MGNHLLEEKVSLGYPLLQRSMDFPSLEPDRNSPATLRVVLRGTVNSGLSGITVTMTQFPTLLLTATFGSSLGRHALTRKVCRSLILECNPLNTPCILD